MEGTRCPVEMSASWGGRSGLGLSYSSWWSHLAIVHGGVHQDAWVWSWLCSLGGYHDCRRWLKTLNIEVVMEIVNAFGIIFRNVPSRFKL